MELQIKREYGNDPKRLREALDANRREQQIQKDLMYHPQKRLRLLKRREKVLKNLLKNTELKKLEE